MIKKNEPYLIEYNIRMGDPECQVILPRLKTDIIKIFEKAILNKLQSIKIKWIKKKSMTIVLCSKGYPGKYKKNSHEISFMVFRTGSVLIVGKCEDDLLFEIYEFLKKMFLDEYLEIYEQISENDTKKTKLRTKVKKSYTITKYC